MTTIRTIAELLSAIGGEALQEFTSFADVTHPKIIGDMYEGLTESLLQKVIPSALDLRIVNGFIRLSQELLSPEYDRMLVFGEGSQIPKTNSYIYLPNQVLAIISVKKTLNSKKLEEELLSIARIKETLSRETLVFNGFKDAYRAITKKDAPSEEERKMLPELECFLHDALKLETALPLRVLFAYEGYGTESGLRNAVMNHIEANNGIVGPVTLPNLIVCGKFCLIKSNGLPFGGPVDKNGFWHFYLSASGQPFYYLLEVLLTRLSYHYKLSIREFDDLTLDSFNIFLKAAPERKGQKIGWNIGMSIIAEKRLAQRSDSEWEPRKVTEGQVQMLLWINDHGPIKHDDWVHLEKQMGIDRDALLRQALDTELVYLDVDGNVSMIYDDVTIGRLGGEYYAVDNTTDRLQQWIAKKESIMPLIKVHINSDGTLIISSPKEGNQNKQ